MVIFHSYVKLPEGGWFQLSSLETRALPWIAPHHVSQNEH